jgi:hypothetical protein
MSSKSKKAVLIALISMIVFGVSAQRVGNRQKKTKGDLIAFLRDKCGAEGVLVNEKGIVTLGAVEAVRRELGDGRDAEKQVLWDRFRYYDYWLSVCRTLFAVGLFILFFVAVRTVLEKITISKKVYGKFRSLDDPADKSPRDERKP